jgi:prepilin-type processing-associated H-X9-DG protein
MKARHGFTLIDTQAANYLYLDGHAVSLTWDAAVPDMYPDKVVLSRDGSYAR